MIFIGLGANLTAPDGTTPVGTCARALDALATAGITVGRCSGWYRSAPVPINDQPWFVNGVAEVAAALDPAELLAALHGIERRFGRVRSVVNAPRVLDLDLLLYGDRVEAGAPGLGLVLPHPRLHQRAFVLRPLSELLPADWRHPSLGRTLADLIADLPGDQIVEKI